MSKLRSINTSIWNDTWFEELDPEQKLLFIYLITNDKTNMLGVYEISIRKISFETSISKQKIEKSFEFFEKSGKIKYAYSRVILLNFLKHQNYNNNMKISAVRCYNELPKELKTLKSGILEESKQGFETLCNGFGMVRKIEVEIEDEDESECESEKNNAIAQTQKFDNRVLEFKKSLIPFLDTQGGNYSKKIVEDFFDYWSEPNKSKTKMRWEIENTFEVSRRLKKWSENGINFNKNGKQQNTNNAKESVAELGRLADQILANASQNNSTNNIF